MIFRYFYFSLQQPWAASPKGLLGPLPRRRHTAALPASSEDPPPHEGR